MVAVESIGLSATTFSATVTVSSSSTVSAISHHTIKSAAAPTIIVGTIHNKSRNENLGWGVERRDGISLKGVVPRRRPRWGKGLARECHSQMECGMQTSIVLKRATAPLDEDLCETWA